MIALLVTLAAWLLFGLWLNKGSTYINDYLLLVFNNTNIALVGDATGLRGSTTPGSLYFGLYTADPGIAGSQTTNEAAYTNYARVAVARSSSGFTVTGSSVSLFAAATFPAGATGDTDVLLFWAVGVASTSTGKILYSGPLGPTALGAGVTVAATDVITIPGLSGVAVNDRIVFTAPTGGTIPTGITVGTVYFVKTVSTNDITISTTLGGSVVDITSAGQVLAYKVTPVTMGGGIVVTPSLTTGLTITEK